MGSVPALVPRAAHSANAVNLELALKSTVRLNQQSQRHVDGPPQYWTLNFRWTERIQNRQNPENHHDGCRLAYPWSRPTQTLPRAVTGRAGKTTSFPSRIR